MSRRRLKINLMTAGLTPGDAISNYMLSKARLLREMGARVDLYADFIHPDLARVAHHSSLYTDTGEAILWYHFSIYADNVQIAMDSHDYKIMDYHGICPPRLYKGQNEHLRFLCQSGIDLLPDFVSYFQRYVVHTEYTRQQLLELGCEAQRVEKIALCVDTSHLGIDEDAALAASLGKLEYLLFVGRVVPQKDILASLAIFAELQRRRPQMAYLIVGSRQHTGRYQRQLQRFVADHNLSSRVMFTGQVNNPALLSALFGNATFYLATSEWESFCVPLAESLFFGVPTVVHDVAPLPEVSGPGGLVVDKHEPRAAAEQILSVLEDEDGYHALSRAAAAWAQQYTDETLRQNLTRFLQQIATDG
ncbi:MAG: glycosyltransferase family 4 protein [Chloroflexota bacterium]